MVLIMCDGWLVILVVLGLKCKIKGIVYDELVSGKIVFIELVEVVEVNNCICELEGDECWEIICILIEFFNILCFFILEIL